MNQCLLKFQTYYLQNLKKQNKMQQPKILKGFQNTNKSLLVKGETVTFGGSSFNIFELKEKDITIHNIAISLARQPRYMGHTKYAYSIGQHCVRGAEALLLLGYIWEAIAFLFHDGGEAFTSDISTPLKRYLDEDGKLKAIEDQIDTVLAAFFGYDSHDIDYELVKLVDKNIAQDEMTSLMAHQEIHAADWYWDEITTYNRYIEMFNKLKCLITYNSPTQEKAK